MKEKIVNNTKVMDVICLHLDRSISPKFRVAGPLAQRWEHLADLFHLTNEMKIQCQSYTAGNLTPSEAMFECLSTTRGSLTIKALKNYLKKIGRDDVVHEFIKKKNDLPGKSIISLITQVMVEKVH